MPKGCSVDQPPKDGATLTAHSPAEPSLDLDLSRYFSVDAGKLKIKRTFVELRLRILIALADSNRTINDLSVRTGINWRTVELHLTYLLGKKFVEEIFSSQYVRIFGITARGREHLALSRERIRTALEVRT